MVARPDRTDTSSPAEDTLWRLVDEVLHYLWDPIGIRGIPAARDEYRSYVPDVVSVLLDGGGRDEIVEYLLWVERDRMEMPPRQDHARHIGDLLVEHLALIRGEGP